MISPLFPTSEPWTLAAVPLPWKQLPGIVPVNFIIRISPLPLVSSELGQARVFFFFLAPVYLFIEQRH